MRRAGRQWSLRAAAAALLLCSCRSAPRPAPAPAQAQPAARPAPEPPAPAPVHRREPAPPQPGRVIAEVNGEQVLALAAPRFAQLPRDQRLLAYRVAQAAAAGQGIALDQSYRHNRAIVRLLRGILANPFVVPPAVLPRIRAFARLVWLHGGLHDPQTGRKEAPPFSAAEFRAAALAAKAAGADLGLGSVSLEYALRALEGPLFNPAVDAYRTVHGADLTASAVNLYDAITARDLRGFQEKYPLSSRLGRADGAVVEQLIRLPAAADALEQATAHAAPPQRAVLDPLAAFLRTGEPEPFREAQRAWLEAAGQVDFFVGFFDRSADPRGRKAIFGGFVGLADAERTPFLEAIAQAAPKLEEKLPWPPAQRRVFARPAAAEALFLAGASGTMRPLRSFALTLPLERGQRDAAGVKTAVFGGAAEAVARLRTDALLRAVADPSAASQLARCLPELRLALLALREIAGRAAGRAPPGDPVELLGGGAGALEEARADAAAHFLSADPLLVQTGLLTQPCQRLWPQFAATAWLAAAAEVPQGDRVEDDSGRAVQLQIWWFTAKGALVERHEGGRTFLAVPDAARFQAAAGELLSVLREIELSGDGARLDDLLARHASRIDTRWRDGVLERMRAAHVPRRIAVIPPRLVPVLASGEVTDAEAVPVDDLDAEILREWGGL